MLVKMKVSQVGNDITRNPGDIVEVSDAEGLRLIEADYATAVKRRANSRTTSEQMGDIETPEGSK